MAILITGDALAGNTGTLATNATHTVYTVPASTSIRIMYFFRTGTYSATRVLVNDAILDIGTSSTSEVVAAKYIYLGAGDVLKIKNYSSSADYDYIFSVMVQTVT